MPIKERDIMSGLSKGLAVIKTFDAAHPRHTVSSAAEACGLDRATTRRCLLTLAHDGYADWDGKFFTLTPRVLRLGTACLSTMPLPHIVQPYLDRLSEEIGESTSVSILDGSEIVYVARAAHRKVMSITLMPGSRLPAYCTSMGRVMLASLPEQQASDLLNAAPLAARTPLTLTNAKAIMEELTRIRIEGYALNNQEVEISLQSLAVPLLNARGKVVAALNVGVPGSNEKMDLVKRFLPKLFGLQAELKLQLA